MAIKFKRISDLRTDNDLLQREIADILGVNRNTYPHWEAGLYEMPLEIIDKLANYYNVSVIYEELPCGICGFVFNHDGVYFIILSKYLSYYKKKKTLLHELAHIELNQLCQSNKDLFAFFIDSYEDEADNYIKEIMKEV